MVQMDQVRPILISNLANIPKYWIFLAISTVDLKSAQAFALSGHSTQAPCSSYLCLMRVLPMLQSCASFPLSFLTPNRRTTIERLMDNSKVCLLFRRSRRLGTGIPASHWRCLGYAAVESHAMEQLQIDMKNLRKVKDTICLVPWNNEGEGVFRTLTEHVIEHHEWMLPHWENVARALKQEQGGKIGIVGFQLTRPVLEAMFPSMQHMQEIGIIYPDLEPTGFHCLFSFLRKNATLLQLLLRGGMT